MPIRSVRFVNDQALGNGYSMSTATGTMAAGLAAGSEIFQFRWTSTAASAVIRSIRISAGTTATAFTAGVVTFDAVIARAFSAAGTGGGAATITTNNAKLRTSFPTTLMGEVRTATTAALGAGTKTLDAQAFAGITVGVVATAGTTILAPTYLFSPTVDAQQPLVLAASEGFVVRATVPATGTWTGSVTVDWMESVTY